MMNGCVHAFINKDTDLQCRFPRAKIGAKSPGQGVMKIISKIHSLNEESQTQKVQRVLGLGAEGGSGTAKPKPSADFLTSECLL